MLLAVVMERHWSFHKMGIDMSAAFDTIQRSTVLNLLKDAGCSEDDIRLVRFLLSNTLIKIRIDKTYSVVFETTLGSFQGDSLSGCLVPEDVTCCCYGASLVFPQDGNRYECCF